MIDSIGFLAFVAAVVYVIWWSFRQDDAARRHAIMKAAEIKRQAGLYTKSDREENAGE